DGIPAVQAEEAAEVDPERAEGDRDEGEDPTDDRASPLAYHGLHEVQRCEAEQHTHPGERSDRDGVVPVWRERVPLQMDEVRREVRRVREKKHPEAAEDEQRQA